jgi:heterodisulfide reductase subunit A
MIAGGPEESPGAVLVVGGGVGGMRAAMDLAETGIKCYLVEETPSLGGRVAQLGFMFPTHDCVLCRGSSDHGYGCTRPAISPAFLDHNRHPNIDLMTNTEISDVTGQAGDFAVTLTHNPRYVDPERCTNCGLCNTACPVEIPSTFQMGLTMQKAAYKVAPRSIPDAYVIERGDYCNDCKRCVSVCPTQAINLDEQPTSEQIHVGAIILALGYQPFSPRSLEEYGFGRYDNVLTSMQFERYVSRSGPTEGFIVRPSDGATPKRIAWLQCIGSRDQERPYCSSICCMFATKEAMLAKQRAPDAECQVFIMDERAFNKEYNAYWHRAEREYNVKYTRCRVSMLREAAGSKNLTVAYQAEDGTHKEEEFDLVILSVGTRPPAGADELSRKLGIDLNEFGFCMTDKFAPLETSEPGIFVCGAFSSPKEIAETIIEASGAASGAMRLLRDRLGLLQVDRQYPFLPRNGFPEERDVTGEATRTGVFVCRCGTSISGTIDTESVTSYARSLPGVAFARELDYACFPDGTDCIEAVTKELGLNRVVVAACSHRTHESLFQRVLRETGLNPYLLEMINLREHCAWVHEGQPAAATRKAKELVRLAVARAEKLEPLSRTLLSPQREALVIGGGISGMTAALAIADSGFDVTLLEKDAVLGGNLHHIYYVAEGHNPQRLLRDVINRVVGHEHIRVMTQTELIQHSGHVGEFTSVVRTQRPGAAPLDTTVNHAVTIVAVGGREWSGDVYQYGLNPRVLTMSELEERITHQPEEISRLKQVVVIQCVHPAEGEEYCSRICCTNTIKNAIRIKLLNPECQVVVLYKNIVTYGFREQYYNEARRRGVLFVRYDDDHLPQVTDTDGKLSVEALDPTLHEMLHLEPDLLLLSTAVLPAEKTSELAAILNVPLSSEGFFMENHLKMRPMDFTDDGIYLCGAAHYPKFIEECIAQAEATAARAMTVLMQDSLFVGGVVAQVDPTKCTGCLTCVRICPFSIPRVDPAQAGIGSIMGAAYIDPARCQGCGTCTAECPAVAIQLVNYRDAQIMLPEIGGLGRWLPDVVAAE